MLVGIVAGIITGALWGLTFVAARAVLPFTPWDVNVARYGIFGLMSLALMVHPLFRPGGMSNRQLTIGLALGVVAYPSYFIAVAYAVAFSGPTIPPLVVGMMPVILAILGNRGGARLPWRTLALPLGIIALGVLIVNGAALVVGGAGSGNRIGLGVLCAIASLAAWVGYGWINNAVMQSPDAPTALRWTCVQGVGALIGSIALLPMTRFTDLAAVTALPMSSEGVRFLAWAALMGIGGSWFAAWAWVVASERLPLSLAAQLIVFETVFGLIAGFVFEQRWPNASEWIGSVLQLAGVAVAIPLFTRAQPSRPSPAVSPDPCPQS